MAPAFFSRALLLVCLALLLVTSVHADEETLNRRFARLARGVNIHYWVDEKNAKLINLDAPTNRITEKDVRLLKKHGFTHVRIGISPYVFLQNLHFQEENLRTPAATQMLGEIHRMVTMFIENDIAVVLTVVPGGDIRDKLFSDPAYQDEWAGFFWHWGQEFSRYDPEYFFFEMLNEPDNYSRILGAHKIKLFFRENETRKSALYDANKMWAQMQAKFLTALRVHAKDNTLIATADDQSSHRALLLSEPVADKNVIYAFHYYYPYVFTHQGADWAALPSPIDSLTYPAYDSNCQMVKNAVGSEQREAVDQYCKEAWGRKRHEELLGALKDWAEKNHVKVWAGEFGVFPNKAEKTSVFNYLFDTRGVFEEYHMGWCAWEYAGWLGRLEDKRVKEALGAK